MFFAEIKDLPLSTPDIRVEVVDPDALTAHA
jgi:hypothetical protein